ncbi:hypothetical protein TNCV_4863141 [Trichonephila clavipes]|nr:hypothetical protein TNCV_4863141 [Trichonephila clavipes]
MHEQEQDSDELESIDLVQSEDRMTIAFHEHAAFRGFHHYLYPWPVIDSNSAVAAAPPPPFQNPTRRKNHWQLAAILLYEAGGRIRRNL